MGCVALGEEMMSDFDRKLAKCIGSAAVKANVINRDVIASCYKEVSLCCGVGESNDVSEKWIDFLVVRLADVKIEERRSESIAQKVFEKIAKT